MTASSALPRVSVADRRRLLVRRHALSGGAPTPEAATAAVLALHATDPASVYLSILARSAQSTLADVAASLYETRSLVRWMAMRRTLFVVHRGDVPVVHAGASVAIGAMLRRQLISRIVRCGTEPGVGPDVDRWLAEVEAAVERELAAAGELTGAELAAAVPALQTTILAGAPSSRPARLTTSLLTSMAAGGRIARGAPTGSWRSRTHRWAAIGLEWPRGLPAVPVADAQTELARRWLERFGPATVEDLRWWTGWGVATTRDALARIDLEEVDLHGVPGIRLRLAGDGGWGDSSRSVGGRSEADAPVATLLPALDPTPMGWKHREWFLGIDPARIFDTAGNIGPTIWLDGEIIGSWAVTRSGDVATAVLADRGADAREAIAAAAQRLQARLDGAVVTPAFRTELERSLSA